MADKSKTPTPPANYTPRHSAEATPILPQQSGASAPSSQTSEAMKALEEKRNSQRRKRRIKIIAIIVILTLLVLLFAGYLIKKQLSNQVAAQAPTDFVVRGTFDKTISNNGVLQPMQNQSVSPTFTGTIKEVKVAAGDTVKEGELLFTFESPELKKAVRAAEIGVKEAENGVLTAQQGVKQAVSGYNKAVDQYNEAVAQAENAHDQALLQKAKMAAAQAQAEAQAAQAAQQQAVIDQMIQSYKQGKIQKGYRNNLVQWGNAQQSQYDYTFDQAYEIIKKRESDGYNVSWVTNELKKAQTNPDGSLKDGSSRAQGVDDLGLNTLLLKSQLVSMGIDPDNAQASGASALAGMEGVAQAQGQGADAPVPETAVPKFDKDGLTATIDTAKLGVKSAQLNLENAKIALDEAQKAYNNGEVTAKITGQVLQVNIEPGSKIEQLSQSGKPAIQIANVSGMKAEMNVNEIDILKVRKDLVAKITFNALPDYTAEGKVVSIASSPTGSGEGGSAVASMMGAAGAQGGSGVVSYPVGIVLENPDPRLKVGMSASIELTLEHYDNVLMVPISAVFNDGDKPYINKVKRDSNGVETYDKVFVKVISSNETSSVIESDQIKEGDEVSLQESGDSSSGSKK